MVLTLQHRKESRLSMEPFVKFEHVKKVYHMGEITIEALRDASFEIEKGDQEEHPAMFDGVGAQ